MARIAVDLDREPEGVEDGAAQFRVGVGQCLAEIGNAFENLAGGIDVGNAVLALLGGQARERRLCLAALLLQRPDALADDQGVDADLDCGELALDPLLDLTDLAHEPLAGFAVVAVQLLGQLGALGAEVIEALRPEDAGGEEGIDDLDQRLLADVLPFAVTERLCRLVAVADPVAAGVIGVVLTRLAVHAQRVVAGGAMDDSAQLVEALLLAGSARAARSTSLAHLGLHPFEDLVGDERLVTAVGLDPLLRFAAHQRSLALLHGAKVEPVPKEPARVDVVLEDRAQRVLRPLASGVALGVDVGGRGRSTGPVEVVGDLLVAPAREEALEHFSDHRPLLGVDDEAGLLVSGSCPGWVGMRLVLEPVAIGRTASVAIALPRVLSLPPSHLAAELLDLELVERLEHVTDKPPLGTGLIAGRERVEDLDASPSHLPLVGEGMK